MKYLFKILKRIIISSFLLYIYNYFAISYNLAIPINVFTVVFVAFFGLFGLLGLLVFEILIL